MLDKIDVRHFGDSDVASAIQAIQGTLYQYGVALQQTGPNTWTGRGTQASYSIVPKVGITAMPIQNGFSIDLRVSADFETNGLILFVVAWLFFFPVAIILALLAYQDWERRATMLVQAVWSPLSTRMIAPPAPVWGPPAVGAPPGPPPGAGYGGQQ